MISDDLAGVAKHLSALVDGRGRLVMKRDTARAVLACLDTIAEQMATFERNAVRLDALPIPADDPVKLIRALEGMAKKARALNADVESWAPGPLGRGQQQRIDDAVAEVAVQLDDVVVCLRNRAAGTGAGTAADSVDSRARASGPGEVVDLAARRAVRQVPLRRAGPEGGAA